MVRKCGTDMKSNIKTSQKILSYQSLNQTQVVADTANRSDFAKGLKFFWSHTLTNVKNLFFFSINLWKRLPHFHSKGRYFRMTSVIVYSLYVDNQTLSNIILPIITSEEKCKLAFNVFNFLLTCPYLHLALHRNLKRILFTPILFSVRVTVQ